MKHASYRAAVEWIALNDSAADDDNAEAIAGYVTSCLVADIFGIPTERVGADVYRARMLGDVDPLDEYCGTCKAPPGHACTNVESGGRAMSSPHGSRVLKARRHALRGGSDE